MKLVIAGSRNINVTVDQIKQYCNDFNLAPTAIISGGASGVDKCGEKFANKMELPIHLYPAQWDVYGKRAGPIRNKKMAINADALLLIWDGSSNGSMNMKQNMLELDKPIHEVIIGNKETV